MHIGTILLAWLGIAAIVVGALMGMGVLRIEVVKEDDDPEEKDKKDDKKS